VRLLERGSPGIIARFGSEPDLVKILQHPTTSVACDCGAVTGDAAHPRYYGTFPRVLGRYVREQKVLTWEEAIRKMSGLPAATIGMVERGLLAVGMAADVVVFDPATIVDHATFEEPTLRSDGIRHVLINGRFAMRDGTITGDRAGRAVTRTAHMPTRPMNGDVSRGVRRAGAIDQVRVTINLRQDAGARHASGRLRIVDRRRSMTLEMRQFGILQTLGDWASVTGRARLRASEPETPLLLIVDGQTVIVEAGEYKISGELSR
jgi:hypothetical protein